MSHVLGIDGGATGTVCLLMDDNSVVSGRGVSGPSNIQIVGVETALGSIQAAVAQAVESTAPVEVEAVCLGMAGAGRASDRRIVRDLVERLTSDKALPVKWSLKPSTTLICSDGEIALMGGTGRPEGVVVIAGTGSFVYGRNRKGQTKRVGGWGHILGDEGGGYDIGLSGIRAALRSHDRRSGSTKLTEYMIEHFKLNRIDEIIEKVYRQGLSPDEIASFCIKVDQAAVGGDEIAIGIIDHAVQELVQSTRAVIKDLFMVDELFDVVTAGGVWRGRSGIRNKFAASLTASLPSVRVSSPRNEPAYGACLMALNSFPTPPAIAGGE